MASRVVVFALSVLCLLPAFAQSPSTGDQSISSPDRFRTYEDTYALWHRMENNGWAGNDEWALRAHYSFRYLMSVDRESIREVFFSYTGEFDFYLGTRDSGPVINRLSNPGLHIRWNLPGPQDFFEAGVEHRSDGQTVEVTSPPETAAVQRAYADRDRPYFDQLSRGSNFVSLAAKWTLPGVPCTAYAKGRIYFSQDSAVTWGPLAGRNVRIWDYDRLTLRLIGPDHAFFGQFEGQATLGDQLGDSSYELGWQAPESTRIWSLPLFIRLHHGPMNTLSNYTQRQDSIGIGLRFAWIGRTEERARTSALKSTS